MRRAGLAAALLLCVSCTPQEQQSAASVASGVEPYVFGGCGLAPSAVAPLLPAPIGAGLDILCESAEAADKFVAGLAPTITAKVATVTLAANDGGAQTLYHVRCTWPAQDGGSPLLPRATLGSCKDRCSAVQDGGTLPVTGDDYSHCMAWCFP